MSIISCSKCGDFVDTDYFPEVFYRVLEDGRTVSLSQPICLVCQERIFNV